MIDKILKKMGYKTYSGRWDMQEVYFDAVVYTALAWCIAVVIIYG